jgi:hypothetical protein
MTRSNVTPIGVRHIPDEHLERIFQNSRSANNDDPSPPQPMVVPDVFHPISLKKALVISVVFVVCVYSLLTAALVLL